MKKIKTTYQLEYQITETLHVKYFSNKNDLKKFVKTLPKALKHFEIVYRNPKTTLLVFLTHDFQKEIILG